jgi:uncharacterized membrane protein YbaN (DUF454 family)
MTALATFPAPVPVTGWRRTLYKGLGWASLGLGAVGAVVPGLPTAPFVLLGSYFFVRSSPELHAWLLKSKWFGGMLRNWETYHGVSRGVKVTAVTMMAVSLGATVILFDLPAAVIAGLVTLELVGLTYVLRLPIVAEPQVEPALA